MRETCYFKDDDYMLSVVYGNYVTLTNLSCDDIDEIIENNAPRINISIHTTNPELRVKMLNNKNAGDIMYLLKKFALSGITMNGQIVLCPGYNDKAELDRTLSDLLDIKKSFKQTEWGSAFESVSVVPVGLTKHRQGLPELTPYDKESSLEVVRQVEAWQEKFREDFNSSFVYLADEFYLMAGVDIPNYDHYEGFPQIENGVGLIASLKDEFDSTVGATSCRPPNAKSIITGELAYDFICRLVGNMANVYKIRNNFFGESVTVAGLVTGGDIIEQLKGKELGDKLLIPRCMLKHEDDVFLDDTSVSDIERELGVKVVVVDVDGYSLLEELTR
jgi:putative radical SAM enzyme (TIGR03279 family)